MTAAEVVRSRIKKKSLQYGGMEISTAVVIDGILVSSKT
jgi:hypothetical protein